VELDSNFIKLPREFYVKEFTCPYCDQVVPSPMVKSSAVRVIQREPDFHTTYAGPSPLHYSVIVCPSCCFAAECICFEHKHLIADARGLGAALGDLRRDFGSHDFACVRDLPSTAAAFDMAWAQTPYLSLKHYQLGGLALRCGWVYREWHELSPDPALAEKEKSFVRLAVQHYKVAYEHEDPAELRIGAAGVGYIVGELLRQLGDFSSALTWLTRIATDRRVSGEIKRLARSQLDLARSQRAELKELGKLDREPSRTRANERVVLNLYRDQARWLESVSKGQAFTSTDLLRALLDALKQSGLDLSGLKDEDALRKHFAQMLEGLPHKRESAE